MKYVLPAAFDRFERGKLLKLAQDDRLHVDH
jgi:hypothetical protein